MIATPPVAELRRRSGRKWSRYPADVLPAWIADMDFAPAPPIARALEEALAVGDFGYGPPAADSGVAEAFAAWAERRWQWRLDPADVMLAPDVVGALANCVEALTEPGEAVLVHMPSYPPLPGSVRSAGRTLVEQPLDAGAFDFAALQALVEQRRVRMLLLCHPHNPTGRVYGAAELRALAGIAALHDLVVVSDEVHADLTFPQRRHLPFAPFLPERTVTLNAPSKAFNVAGLRTAICVAPQPLRARLAALPSTRWNAFSTLGVRAARAAWSPEGEAWLRDCVAFLARQSARIARRIETDFPRIGFDPPEASYLAWLDCRRLGLGDDPAAWFLDRAKVALSPGPDFGPPGKGFARLNFATSEALLDEMLDRMRAALAT